MTSHQVPPMLGAEERQPGWTVTSVLGLYTHSLPVTDMGTEINPCYS